MSEYVVKFIDDFSNQYFDYLIMVCDEVIEVIFEGIYFSKKIYFSILDFVEVKGLDQEVEVVFLKVCEMVKWYMFKFLGKVFVENVEVV